jgi:hypothetical protein
VAIGRVTATVVAVASSGIAVAEPVRCAIEAATREVPAAISGSAAATSHARPLFAAYRLAIRHVMKAVADIELRIDGK